MTQSLQVVLVRLAECQGNVDELVARHGNLTDRGRRQAYRAREQVDRLGISSFYSAETSACQQTALILAGGGAVQVAAEFNEPPYPVWAGKTLGEVAHEWPEAWQSYWNPELGDADRIIVPQGESFKTTFQRAKRGLDRIYNTEQSQHGVCFCTHGEVVRLLTVHMRPLKQSTARHTSLALVLAT